MDALAATFSADVLLKSLASFLAANPLLTLVIVIVLICLIKFR